MATLDQEQVRSLDQIRTRLLTLRASLVTLSENLATQQPLPSASALQTHASVVSVGLQSIAEQLAEHRQLLNSTHIFPLPQYPSRPFGHILTDTLLRTKAEPQVQEWIEQGADIADEKAGPGSLSKSDLSELWRWAPGAANREARKQKWGADYTLAEVQNGIGNVSTGLRRELVIPLEEFDEEGDDDDEYDEVTDEDDEEDKMEIAQPVTNSEGNALPSGAGSGSGSEQSFMGRSSYLETLQEFMTTGRVERYKSELVDLRREAEKKKQGNMPA